MNKKPHITYNELLDLISWGLFAMNFKGVQIVDDRLNQYKSKSIDNAHYKGIYVGSPGVDIYYMLPFLKDTQMEEVADKIVDQFPKTPPGNHVNIGMFVRFLYGQFEKQGTLRSEKDLDRMKNEEIEWGLPRKFIKLLFDKMSDSSNFYGVCILCEMEAHRLGDEAVLNNDYGKIVEMEVMYNKSVKFAHKCGSYKQMFTPYYWCFEYFKKCKNKEKALEYSYLTMENAEKHCPDARPGYVDKLLSCIKYVKKYDKEEWKDFCRAYKNSKNKCVKKSFKKYKVE